MQGRRRGRRFACRDPESRSPAYVALGCASGSRPLLTSFEGTPPSAGSGQALRLPVRGCAPVPRFWADLSCRYAHRLRYRNLREGVLARHEVDEDVVALGELAGEDPLRGRV